MGSSKDEDFPPDMKQPIRELHDSLNDLKTCLNQFNEHLSEFKSRPLDPLLKAKLELTNAYAINSLFWIYLTTKGVDPQEHPIKQEIIRLKTYAERVKQIEDKQKAMKLDANAAKRFVRSALWEPNEDKKDNQNNSNNKRRLSDQISKDLNPNFSSDPKRHKKFKK